MTKEYVVKGLDGRKTKDAMIKDLQSEVKKQLK